MRLPCAWSFQTGLNLLLWCFWSLGFWCPGPAAGRTAPVDFSREILPILSENCFHCHGPDARARKADLRLDTREGALHAGKEGVAAVVPGNPDASELVKRILSDDADDVMPPPKANRKLSALDKQRLERWVLEGAVWGEHWAFTPILKPVIPKSDGANPIDAFVRERLKREDLDLQPAAPKRTLLRRLSLDLTGLPPTLEEVELFDADAAEGSYERVVDRLLASPRFGERMAWEWIEAARYADTNGYQGDNERTMWPWRDWVVNAFNRNLPYDQFTVWQIAGDLLPAATEEHRLATAFLRNHPINGEGGRIAEENRVDYVMDMAETTGTVWLGLTFNCCRCHDHKYDPLLQEDYYRFFGFFNQTPVSGAGGDPQTAPRIDRAQPEEMERLNKAKSAMDSARGAATAVWKASADKRAAWAATESDAEIRKALEVPEEKWSATQRKLLEEAWEKQDSLFLKARAERESKQQAFDTAARTITRVMVMADMPKPRPTFILERGLYTNPGKEVAPGVPTKLPPLKEGDPANRLGLAQWLVSKENPLTARVTVNRFWQQLFGIGLVKTAEDFGVQAESPIHRDLLDWLAAEFRESGWNVKGLLRLIVTSDTYRQSSSVTKDLSERDPQNRLLARGARFRMPSWMIRDQALAASGLITPAIGGPPVKSYQPDGVWEEATFGNKKYVRDSGPALYRRSLYTFWRRIIGPTMFFDTGNRATCVVKPIRTNTPLHALTTLNDPAQVEAARVLAQKIWLSPDTGVSARIQSAFERVLCRAATEKEQQIFSAGIERHMASFRLDPGAAERILRVGASPRDAAIPAHEHAAYAVFCLSMFNLDEALTKE